MDPAQPSRPETFVDLYEEAYVAMVRLARLLTGSIEAGEEIAQEAFAAALRRFEDLDNPGAYVRTSVVNGCRSWQRRQRTEGRWFERQTGQVVGPATDGELADVLARLPYRQRAALVLRFYSDLPMQGVAEALACREGTARSLVSRGLARLREDIER